MKTRISELIELGSSSTAKTTYLMFAGNAISAVLAFIIVIVAARSFEPLQFGLFFALYNLVQLISSVADFGVGSGLINFIPQALLQGKVKEANQFLKAGWDFILAVSILLTFIGLFLPLNIILSFLPGVSRQEWIVTVLAAATFILVNFLIFAFQARKEFSRSIVANLSYSAARTILIVSLFLSGKLSVFSAMLSYTASSLIGTLLSLPFLPKVIGNQNKPTKDQFKELLQFSSHLGLGKIAANIASRIDIQILYPLAGAVATAQYGIAQRVAFLYVLFSSSAGAVITPKIASISQPGEMKLYARKIFLLSILLLFGLLFGAAVADPFVPLLFGSKYVEAIPIVRWTLIATVPFILNLTPVNIVIYFQKNSRLIGILSVVQLGIVVFLNLLLVPRIGVYGPIVAFAVGNSFVGLYCWYKVKAIFL